MKRIALLAAGLLLAGCGDPFGGMNRLSETGIGGNPSASVAASGEGELLSEAAANPSDLEQRAAAEAASRSADRPPRGLFAMLGLGNGGGATPAAAPAPGGGLFGGGSSSGPDAQDVPPGTVIPYGRIARVCDLPRRRLGQRVLQESGFTVYDSIPNSTAPRPHYITGFSDGCPRTITGALVLAGDVGTHETVRYQPSNSGIRYTETDEAYEQIKSRICGARRGTPCGNRIDRLARNTVFLTVYERFGGGDRWVEVLLHDRGVSAIDFKE
ncbi:hypothetical protein [Histidinibacterium aquaticum]|uniref:Lipoprotein n=1 Tax=Histidinibacterium aquaticum TaxID=2613962 RepID=A0A5J5GSA9_9RHOB|nr:hypothetical protein [Histidinibacterium aquaticum]KAA9010424.1 hypothetical protein F3S47_04055 [Histidinibacterium aquaticum]